MGGGRGFQNREQQRCPALGACTAPALMSACRALLWPWLLPRGHPGPTEACWDLLVTYFGAKFGRWWDIQSQALSSPEEEELGSERGGGCPHHTAIGLAGTSLRGQDFAAVTGLLGPRGGGISSAQASVSIRGAGSSPHPHGV